MVEGIFDDIRIKLVGGFKSSSKIIFCKRGMYKFWVIFMNLMSLFISQVISVTVFITINIIIIVIIIVVVMVLMLLMVLILVPVMR